MKAIHIMPVLFLQKTTTKKTSLVSRKDIGKETKPLEFGMDGEINTLLDESVALQAKLPKSLGKKNI